MQNEKVLTKQLIKSILNLEEMIKQKSSEEKARDEYQKKMKITWEKVTERKAHLKTYEKLEVKYQLHKENCMNLSSLIGRRFYEIRKVLEEVKNKNIVLDKCVCTYGWILVLSDLVLVSQNYGKNGYLENTLQKMKKKKKLASEFKKQYDMHNIKEIKLYYLDAKEFIENGYGN